MLYYAQGNAIMTADEIFEPQIFDSLTGFFSKLNQQSSPATLSLPTGDLKADEAGKFKLDNDIVSFKPIGLGLPLSVMVTNPKTKR